MRKTAVIPVLIQVAMFSIVGNAAPQQVDTLAVYRDRSDTLSAAAVSGAGASGSLSRYKDLRTEVITAAGLCKMACCNLAESFENSASVTVGYSDAVTGARQIRLLGLSGTYTQMLDENRPVMRGIAAPFGLSYVPGQWLSSIQIAKGAPSVLNGVESITGQINMEHRKPTDEIPLFVNASVMSDVKADLNVASSLQLSDKWSTAILGHVSGNFVGHDMNRDGILDDPRQLQLNLSNRWLYFDPDGVQVRFGLRILRDSRRGGEYDPSDASKKAAYDYGTYRGGTSRFWGSSILNRNFNAYLKVGVPLNEDNTRNVALVADFNDYSMDSGFGSTLYNAGQMSWFANVLYQDQKFEAHHYTLGLNVTCDRFREDFRRPLCWATPSDAAATYLLDAGAFGEYTFRAEDRLSVIAGLRADYYNTDGFRLSPRLTVKYSPVEQLVLRLNGGRGLRHACPLADNIGVLSTSKPFYSQHLAPGATETPISMNHMLEDAWIAGGNATVYLPFGATDNTYLSFDYFRTQFSRQLVLDYDSVPGAIDFYSVGPGRSYTNTCQVDFNVEPVERFSVTATFRYTDAMVDRLGRGLSERPMTSRFKGVLNLQYATNLNKWIFDFTASVNGPCKVWDFMAAGDPQQYKNGLSPVYPLLYLQVTHRMKGWDLYVGAENLTNFTQKGLLQGTEYAESGRAIVRNPALPDFDASCVWGPLMGIKAYAGVRITIWKKG